MELGAHDFAIVDAHVGRLLHLELVDVECVLAVLEDMGAMVSVDQPLGLHLNADLFAKLCVVEPLRGRVIVLTEGSMRCRYRDSFAEPVPLEKDTPTLISFPLQHTAYEFPAGSRVALVVTSSCFPRILPNSNNMEPILSTAPARKARTGILGGPAYPSALKLPVVAL